MNTGSKFICFTAFVFLLFFTVTPANAENSRREAVCTITSGGKVHTINDCIATYGASEKYNWIFLERKDAEPLLEEILLLSVYEISPDKAQVSGLTQNGNNSRWGEALKQKDCYIGSDFSVCIKNK